MTKKQKELANEVQAEIDFAILKRMVSLLPKDHLVPVTDITKMNIEEFKKYVKIIEIPKVIETLKRTKI